MEDLIKALRQFARERDWEKFHSPKNLAMALSVEAAEIVELFQWMTEEESRGPGARKVEKLRDEIGDVLIYLVNLADKFGIDPVEAAREKVRKNASRYPARLVRGRADKYDEY
ncbi:MAG: nucleotide pyrophosphohydrolase [Thermodesulfovibrionales bacterium]